VTDGHQFIASKHDNLQNEKYNNRQKVVPKSNAFACETTQQTVSRQNKLYTETNKWKEKPYNRTKSNNQTITIL